MNVKENQKERERLQNRVDRKSHQITSISLKLGELAQLCLHNKEKIIQSDVDRKNRSKLKAKWVVKKNNEFLVTHTN